MQKYWKSVLKAALNKKIYISLFIWKAKRTVDKPNDWKITLCIHWGQEAKQTLESGLSFHGFLLLQWSFQHRTHDVLCGKWEAWSVRVFHLLSWQEVLRCSSRSHPNTFSLLPPLLRTLRISAASSSHPDQPVLLCLLVTSRIVRTSLQDGSSVSSGTNVGSCCTFQTFGVAVFWLPLPQSMLDGSVCFLCELRCMLQPGRWSMVQISLHPAKAEITQVSRWSYWQLFL